MPVREGNHFLLLYGSQTGQAQAIAEEIAEKATNHQLVADIHCLSQVDKKFHIEREKCVVIVISTTGDGEPPETALKFFRRIKKKTLSSDYLSSLNYTLLGLGDSNYTNFCNCGKSLDNRLQELGSKHFYGTGWADDATGLEIVVEPWIDGLWPVLKRFLQIPIGDNELNMNITNTVTNSEASHNADIDSIHITDTLQLKHAPDNQTSISQQASANTNQNSFSVVPNSANISDDSKAGAITSSIPSVIDSTLSSSNKQTGVVAKTVHTQSSGDHAHTGDTTVNERGDNPTKASVKICLPPLSESTLTTPLLPPAYLQIEYNVDEPLDMTTLPMQNGLVFPSAASPVTMATIASVKTLTQPSAVKKTLAVELNIKDSDIQYEPGDAFSVICPNSTTEVDALLKRLGVEDKADTTARISVLEATKKKNASVPKWVPSLCTLRHVFQTCLDIREPPKKALLRVLVEYTELPTEKRRLQELCSKQGATDYTSYIRQPALSVLDMLHHFPSCMPPVETIIEHLPRLQPRPYSICSSQLKTPGSILFTFNVIDIPMEDGRSFGRKGVCTGWLEEQGSKIKHNSSAGMGCAEGDVDDLHKQMEHLDLDSLQIPIFARSNQHFHLPNDVSVPVILIGPGTGVAPFIGYLDHRAEQRKKDREAQYGDIWLFYGCRHQERDYLFRKQLEDHMSTTVLSKLLVSFSRDMEPEGSPRYVQDNIRLHSLQLVELLSEKGAVVFVCGDAKNMARDVNDAFVEIYGKEKGVSAAESRKFIMQLRIDKRYMEDVWT